MTTEYTLLFIDDHPIYCEGMALALSQQVDNLSVHTADSSESALALLAGQDIDLVLCDYRLRDEDGISLLRELSAKYPYMAVGILSADPTPQLAARAAEAGAVAYLSKERDAASMAAALRQLFRGVTVFDVEPATLDDMGITSRRIDVLRLAAQGHSNREIAEQLNIAESTIKDHWAAIYKRLGTNNRVVAIRKAHELGLIEAHG